MADKNQSAFDQILGYAQKAVPLAQQFIYGGAKSSAAEMADEQNQWDMLNGSGAPDRDALRKTAAKGQAGALFGDPSSAVVAGFNLQQILLFALVSIAVAWVVKKFL